MLLGGTGQAWAAAPANDNFASATLLSGASNTTGVAGTTVEATVETGEPKFFTANTKSVWYKWVAPSNSAVEFSTTEGILGVFTGTTLTGLARVRDWSYPDTAFQFSPVSGSTYYIACNSFGGSTFTLTWQGKTLPTNVPAPTTATGTSQGQGSYVTVGSYTVKNQLQMKLASEPDEAFYGWGSRAASETTTYSFLRPGATYTFRMVTGVVTGPGTYDIDLTTLGQPVDVTMLSSLPAPVFSSRTATTLSGTTPALPAYATSLTLYLNDDESDYYYSGNIANLAGNTAFTISGLRPNTKFTAAYVAQYYGGSSQSAYSPGRTAPYGPAYSDFSSTSLKLTAPILETGPTWTLERASGTATVPTAPTSNLELWLKADAVTGVNSASRLGTWSDSSGNNLHATQVLASRQPLWIQNAVNGRPVVRFDGSKNFLNLPSGFSTYANGVTVFTVVKPKVQNNAPPLNLSDSIYANNYSPIPEAAAVMPPQAGQWQIFTNTFWAPAIQLREKNTVGRGNQWGFFQGDVAEVLVYNKNLTTTERQAVESYLAAKYALPTAVSPAGLTWGSSVATAQTTGSIFNDTGRSSATTYWYRYVTSGATGLMSGATTGPAAPGVPTFNSITSSSLNVVAPALPAGAGSLTLQYKKVSDSVFNNEIENIAGGSTTPVYGLEVAGYHFRFIAVGANASTPGSAALATMAAAPSGPPGEPTFLDVTNNLADGTPRVVVRAPSLPAGAARMILQAKSATEVDGAFSAVVDITSGLEASSLLSNAVTTVNRVNGHYLTASTTYLFRYVAVTSTNVETPGTPGDITIPEPEAVAAPGAPSFTDLTTTSVKLKAPPLPDGAIYLDLQIRPQNVVTYTTIGTQLEAGAETAVTYPTTQKNHYFRYIAVSTQGSTVGLEISPTTIPEAPVVTGTTTAQTVTFNTPSPTGTNWEQYGFRNCILQCKKVGEPDSAYADWTSADWYWDATLQATQLAPGTAYTFRWKIPGYGIAYGAGTNVTTPSGTQPDAPAAPTFTNIGGDRVTVNAPSTTLTVLRADKLKLQRGSGTSWTDVADNLTPGAATLVTGLSATTEYSFRYLAIKNGPPVLTTIGAVASVSTEVATPEVPDAPTFVSATTTSITVTLPPINKPLRTDSLTLQYKLTEGSGDFVDWGTGHLAGGTSVTVTGLATGRSYLMRVKAHAEIAGQPDTFGNILGTGTTAPAPTAPGAPQSVTIIDPYTVQVKAPVGPIPANTDYLKLQVLPLNQGTTWVDIEDSDGLDLAIQPNEVTELSGFTPGLTYQFRYASVGTGGVAVGPSSANILMPVTSAGWASAVTNTIAKTIQCKGIRYPVPNAGTVTVARGASLRLSSYLATDFDARVITATGSPYTASQFLSDPCVYFWNVVDASNNPVYSFQDGVNRAQNVVWIAPNVAGTYTISLVVSDQEGLNKAATEANSRDDLNRGTWDAPLTFKITVNVP